MLDQLPTW